MANNIPAIDFYLILTPNEPKPKNLAKNSTQKLPKGSQKVLKNAKNTIPAMDL